MEEDKEEVGGALLEDPGDFDGDFLFKLGEPGLADLTRDPSLDFDILESVETDELLLVLVLSSLCFLILVWFNRLGTWIFLLLKKKGEGEREERKRTISFLNGKTKYDESLRNIHVHGNTFIQLCCRLTGIQVVTELIVIRITYIQSNLL